MIDRKKVSRRAVFRGIGFMGAVTGLGAFIFSCITRSNKKSRFFSNLAG